MAEPLRTAVTATRLIISSEFPKTAIRLILRITLAVAGFTRDELEITLEDKQLTVRGKQQDDEKERDYLYRGIASRQFSRTFVLADGIEVKSAELTNGLLAIDLQRLEPEQLVRRIEIGATSRIKSPV